MDNSANEIWHLDDQPDIIKFSFYDNILLWPLVRYHLFELKNETLNKAVEVPKFKLQIFKYIFNITFNNPIFIFKKKNISTIILGSSTSNQFEDGLFFNKVNDHFYNINPQSTIFIERSLGFNIQKPRTPNKIFYHDSIFILSEILKYLTIVPKKEKKRIKEFIDYLVKHDLNIKNEHINFIYNKLTSIRKKLPILKFLYKNLYEKLNPEFLLFEDASYGSKSYIIKWAKEEGIKVIEPQHGIINMLAYSYGKAGFTDDYFKFLPDYILIYGKFWVKNIRSPSKLVNIGFPFLEEKIKHTNGNKAKTESSILIISQWNITDQFIDIAIKLSNTKQTNIPILLRLHPKDNLTPNQLTIIKEHNISIDKNSNIYELIQASTIVIASYSTVIFEALAFNKDIFILDNYFARIVIPRELGIWFSNPDELISKINDKPATMQTEYTKQIWSLNWKDNYTKFINEISTQKP